MRKAYEKYVKEVRDTMPKYNHGRRVEVLSGYTRKAEGIMTRARRYDGYDLGDVYGRVSQAKQRAYDEVYDMYRNSPESSFFHIISHCASYFSVSWDTPVDIVVVTPCYEYHVMKLNRGFLDI